LSELTIYKASAGSGKTYRVTGEYLKLLFSDADNYRHILGVTFTNKATAEMKSRIIKELYKLSQGEKSGYYNEIAKIEKINPERIKETASFILSRMLHDYSHFTISTIDSFFQRVLRSFAREIGMLHGFEIELDHQKVLQASIDLMLFNIDNHPELKNWLIQFAQNKIMDGLSWDISSDIESLGNELFKENFKEFANDLYEKITNKNFLESFSSRLTALNVNLEKSVKEKVREALSVIQSNGLNTDDFKGKSKGVGAYFARLGNLENLNKWEISNTILNCVDNVDGWVVKNAANKAKVENAFNNGLNKILTDLVSIYNNEFILYKSISKVQRNLYVLGMIADLQKQIREYTNDKNLFLISDTAELLHKLIDGSDAPFIYERTGTNVRHFMIDEFQDTSVLQWKDFKPLVTNSLAEGNKNWVVGDVKQSIYRWRNSDWTILSDKITGDILPHDSVVETLNYNYRSSINVVKFNNTFFRNVINLLLLQESSIMTSGSDNEFVKVLTGAYSGFEQQVPENKPRDEGYVSVEFIKAENKRSKDWKNDVLAKLPAFVEKLQDSGYKLSEIAILVRDKKEAKLISDYFLTYQKQNKSENYRYDILSGDSLLLKNSIVIKWLLSCFTYISAPDDMTNAAFLVYHFYLSVKEEHSPDLEKIFVPGGGVVVPHEISDFFDNQELRQLSIYELADTLIIYFGLNKIKSELPFILAFQEMLQNYIKREAADIHSFLNWWSDHQDNQVITMPDNQEAMRLMTFHSSKGLEFPAVIIPFGDWEIMKTSSSGNYLWCRSDVAPLNEISLLPLNLSSSLEETVFGNDYLREKALLFVDNINLLYVAFTRAIDVLYILTPDFEDEIIKNNVAPLIKNSLNNQYFQIEDSNFPAFYLPDFYNEEVLNIGTIPEKHSSKDHNRELLVNEIPYPIRPVSDVTHQVITSLEYINGENELHSHLKEGKVLHEIFQNICTADDIDKAISRTIMEGKISLEDKDAVRKKITEAINKPLVCDWFSGNWEIKNEASIMLPDKTIHRPDRVMLKGNKAVVVDYKFGYEEDLTYIKQVSWYMRYLKQMGYARVEGYLWYISLDKLIPVTEKPEQGKLF
jgi:ATP-dependent helicase/nuclease subunit A